jgi:hypothetical protein
MFLSFVLRQSASINTAEIYKGNWSTTVNASGRGVVVESSRFELEFEYLVLSANGSRAACVVTFSPSARIQFNCPNLTFSGVPFSNNTSFFLVSTYPKRLFDIHSAAERIYSLVTSLNMTEPYDAALLRGTLTEYHRLHFPDVPFFTLSVNLTAGAAPAAPFHLGKYLDGVFYYFEWPFALSGSQFDAAAFVIESRKFGVVIAVYVLLIFYSWHSLSRSVRTDASLKGISVHSCILHIGNDFAFALLMLEMTTVEPSFTLLYIFLFGAFMFVYFGYQIGQLMSIWKVHYIDFDGDDVNAFRCVFVSFFGEISILLFISKTALTLVFDYPLIYLTYLTSDLLTQIYHSAFYNSYRKSDSSFVILLTISRFIPLFYFTLYKKNIKERYSVVAALASGGWMLLQMFVILLQNKFGGLFFLPRTMHPIAFDYTAQHPEPGQDCSICLIPFEEADQTCVTPCGHPFHRECLSRWMQEQLICPFCRHELPPLQPLAV